MDKPKLDRDRMVPLLIAGLVGVSVGMLACTALDQIMIRKARTVIPRPGPCDECAQRQRAALADQIAEAKAHAAATKPNPGGMAYVTATYGNGVDSGPAAVFSPYMPAAEEGDGGQPEG